MAVLVEVYLDNSITVRADPSELRREFERELRADGMYDAADDALIQWVYEQNPDLAELEVEDTFA